MSNFQDRFGKVKGRSANKSTVPEHQLRTIQLDREQKKYDEMGRELRHGSKLWEYAARCWHVEHQMSCNQKWIDQERHICFWCPQYSDERNQQADLDNIRWIPPKKHKVLR